MKENPYEIHFSTVKIENTNEIWVIAKYGAARKVPDNPEEIEAAKILVKLRFLDEIRKILDFYDNQKKGGANDTE